MAIASHLALAASVRKFCNCAGNGQVQRVDRADLALTAGGTGYRADDPGSRGWLTAWVQHRS